jgi:hypothetical protein
MKTKVLNTALLVALAIGTSFLLQIGCVSGRFSTEAHFDTTYDFAAVDSFAFDVARPKLKESANGQILEEALRERLVDRGFVEKPKEDADVLVSYDLGVYAKASLSGRSDLSQREGGINVWVFDRETGRQVWYGWSERTLSPDDEPEPTINEAVDAILQNRMPENR